MKTMSARDAKNHFGEFLDAMQREPVLITKNNRPVGMMVSMEEVENSLLADLFMQQDSSYADWVRTKVSKTMQSLDAGEMRTAPLDEVRTRIYARFAEQNKV
ncbi:MAG: type II toxin-antitoxin system Phd/YefM family antitoxin [Sulfuriferula sp.]